MKFKIAIVYRSFSDDSCRSEEATEPFRYFTEDINSEDDDNSSGKVFI